MSPRPVVLQSFPIPRPTTNPYLVQLAEALAPHVEMRFFSWRAALLGRYDVLHVHWPEVMLRGSSPARTWLRRAATAALLARLTLRGTPVVRTVHNPAPHEPPAGPDRALLAWMDRRTRAWIRLNRHTPTPDPQASVTVPHGHYRNHYSVHPKPVTTLGRLLFFGLLRPYKNVPALLRAFGQTAVEEAAQPLTLTVLGSCPAAPLRTQVELAAAADPRVTVRLQHVADADLVAEIGAAELVVLPYTELHNSGAALLALSLDRPVLLPRGPVALDLAREVGPGWVFGYSGELTGQDLLEAVHAVRRGHAQRRGRPNLSARGWAAAGAEHARVYRCATEATPAGRS